MQGLPKLMVFGQPGDCDGESISIAWWDEHAVRPIDEILA
jgi:hypothetical protein